MIESGHYGKIVERAELALLRRQRALARLGLKGALLAPERTGRMLGVFPKGDRRRRPLARLSREDVRALLADGALAPAGFADTYRLTPAGAVRTLREKAEREPWRVQHGDLEERLVMADDGVMRAVWGEPRDGAFARITKVVEKGFSSVARSRPRSGCRKTGSAGNSDCPTDRTGRRRRSDRRRAARAARRSARLRPPSTRGGGSNGRWAACPCLLRARCARRVSRVQVSPISNVRGAGRRCRASAC